MEVLALFFLFLCFSLLFFAFQTVDGFAEQELKVYYNALQAQLAWVIQGTEVDDLEGDEYNDCLNYIIKQN